MLKLVKKKVIFAIDGNIVQLPVNNILNSTFQNIDICTTKSKNSKNDYKLERCNACSNN